MEENINYNNFDKEEALNDILQEDQGQFWRFSILIFCFILLSLMTLSWFITYPDILSANITITNNNNPGLLVSKSEGLLEYLNKNKQVETDEMIAIIKSSINYKEAFELKEDIKKLKDLDVSKYSEKHFEEYSNLGSIQTTYNNFTNLLLEYDREIEGGPFYNKQRFLRKELGLQKERLALLNNKLQLLDSKLEIETEKLQRDTSLYSQNVITKVDVERTKSSLINEKVNKSEGELQVIEYQTRINNLEKTLAQNKLERKDILFDLESRLLSAITSIEVQLKDWEELSVIRAPKSGELSFVRELNENDFINRNEEFAFIIPSENKSNYGIALVPARNYGKLELGQKVIIKLENLNYKEFGVLIGKIKEMSSIPNKGFYTVRVEFDDKELVTNQGFKLEHQVVYLGIAEIITEDLRLLERFLYQLKPVFRSIDKTEEVSNKQPLEIENRSEKNMSVNEVKDELTISQIQESCIVAVGKFAEDENVEKMSSNLIKMGLKIYISDRDDDNQLTLVGFYSDCNEDILATNITMARNEIADDAYSIVVAD